MSNGNRSTIAAGILLVLAGVFFMAQRLFPFLLPPLGWPLILAGIGAAFFIAMLIGGKSTGGLAIPASILTGLGAFFYAQQILNFALSWSYSWAFIVIFIGVGIFIHGVYSDLPETRVSGLRLSGIGLFFLLIFGFFFGLFTPLTNLLRLRADVIPALLLIILGVVILIVRLIRHFRHSAASGRGTNLFWPVILIGLGGIWLATVLGLAPNTSHAHVFFLWPLLLIGLGIILIFGRKSIWVSLIAALLIVASVALVLFTNISGAIPRSRGSWPGWQMSGGTGNPVREERPVSKFNAISMRTIGEIEIKQGDSEALTIQAPSDLLPYITSEVNNGVLEIGVQPGTVINPFSKIIYQITVKQLQFVETSGAARVKIDELTSPSLILRSSGTGNFVAEKIHVQDLSLEISGAGSFHTGGTCDKLFVDISGTGSLEASDLTANYADVSISGTGSADLHVMESMTVDISGVGNVSYLGNPQVTRTGGGLGAVRQVE